MSRFFQLLLCLQHSGLKLLTSGVEHSADILADVRDFAFDAFASLSLLY